jgi:preprotein translocase subunit SecE
MQFLSEVRNELRKVSWPSRKEVFGTTTVVIVSVFIFAAFFFVVDQGLNRLIQFLFTYFGSH